MTQKVWLRGQDAVISQIPSVFSIKLSSGASKIAGAGLGKQRQRIAFYPKTTYLCGKNIVMTRLVLEIPTQTDLDALLPLLRRLKIRYSPMIQPNTADISEAIAIIRKGCDMSNYGDALTYQIEQRKDRELPYRD